MFTEPSIKYQQALAPYQPMAMKVVHCPIDTSLNFTQARKMIREARPSSLVIPNIYSQPPSSAPGRQDLVIDVEVNTFTFQKNDILKIPMVRKLENLELSSALASSLTSVEIRPGVAVATVTGNLVVRDNTFTLHMLEDQEEGEIVRLKRETSETGESSSKRQKRDKRSESKEKFSKFPLTKQKPSHYLYGSLNSSDFVTKLVSKGISDAKVETGTDGGFPVQIHLPQEETLIQVVEDQTHVLYDQVEGTDPAVTERLREVMRETILSCVSKF